MTFGMIIIPIWNLYKKVLNNKTEENKTDQPLEVGVGAVGYFSFKTGYFMLTSTLLSGLIYCKNIQHFRENKICYDCEKV